MIGLRQLECHAAADNAASHAVSERAKFMEVGRSTETSGDEMVRFVLLSTPGEAMNSAGQPR